MEQGRAKGENWNNCNRTTTIKYKIQVLEKMKINEREFKVTLEERQSLKFLVVLDLHSRLV